MATTVEQVAHDALLAVGSDAGLLTASKFIAVRYRELANRLRFRHLRRRAELVMPANVTAGTATFTEGSPIVTGDATAEAAWLAEGPSLRGRFMRVATGGNAGAQPWVEIESVSPAGELTLSLAFTQSTVAAAGYLIVARYHRLADDVRWLGAVTMPRLNRRLRPSSETEIDYYAAGRFIQSGYGGGIATGSPDRFLLAPPDFDGRKRIEIYPPAGTSSEVVNYYYHAEPPRLQPLDVLPDGLNGEVLKEGAIIDLLRLEWAKAVKMKDYDGAAHYRNEFNSQRTRWERDYVWQAGDADTTVSDDYFAVMDLGEPTTSAWMNDSLSDGLWPVGL